MNGADTGDAGRALGAALAANTVLKELDLSSPKGYWCDAEFIQTFSIGLGANGALTSLNLSANNISANNIGGYYDDEYEWIADMTGIKALAAAIPECK